MAWPYGAGVSRHRLVASASAARRLATLVLCAGLTVGCSVGNSGSGVGSTASGSGAPGRAATRSPVTTQPPVTTPSSVTLSPVTTPSSVATTAPPARSTGSASGRLSLLIEPDQGFAPVYALIASAHRSIDLTMYELVDPQADLALDAAAGRGVDVRVILDANREKQANQAAHDELAAMGVHVIWADPRYEATHEKALVVDGSVAAVMSMNLTSRYYSDTRDFAVLDSQPADVAAIEQVFDADFRHVTASEPAGVDLVWSPGQSQPALVQLIDQASSTLLVENEEMASAPVTAALINAAHRGVRVSVVMTAAPQWADDFKRLIAAHVSVRTYTADAALYIHAKAIVADAGTARQRGFVGSENFSAASLSHNRELGLIVSDPTVVGRLAAAIRADAAGAETWRP
jgi:cardiolipin synthase